MSDLKNITINELPFQENLEDTSILHVSDGQDKQTTLARLWEWAKLKVTFTTTPQLKNVILSTSSKKLERIPLESFFQGAIGGLMNAIAPLREDTLLNEGYTPLEIFAYRVARKFPFREKGEYFYMDITDDALLYEFLNSLSAQEYLLTFGITLANGENGSRDGRGVFLRAIDAGAGQESEERQIGQLQRDAMQKMTGYIDTDRGVFIGAGGAFAIEVKSTQGVWTGQDSDYKYWRRGTFDSSRIARTATETRPKNISALLFQKVSDAEWTSLPATPPKLREEQKDPQDNEE